MSLMVVLGARSPGTTATALALAVEWPGGAVFADCDPQGGTVAARLGVAPAPGLTTLASAGRHSCPPYLVAQHLQRTPHDLHALLSPPAPEQVSSALATLGKPCLPPSASSSSQSSPTAAGRSPTRPPAT